MKWIKNGQVFFLIHDVEKIVKTSLIFVVETKMDITEDRKLQAQIALDHLVLWGYFNTWFNKLEDEVRCTKAKAACHTCSGESTLQMSVGFQSCLCRAMAKMRHHSHFRHRELLLWGTESWVPPSGGKVLEKIHNDDLKAMSFETEERHLPNPR